MSIITIPTVFNIDMEFKLAPFHKRLLAWLIDILIVYAYVLAMYWLIFRAAGISGPGIQLITLLFVWLPAYSYHLVMEIYFGGRSVGKMTMGLKVLDMSGREATLSQYLLRWVLRLIDMGVTLGMGAVFAAALTRNGQRLGDLAAGTIVIDQRERTGLHETIYLEVEDTGYKVLFPQVMRLTDRDINGIRNLLAMKEKDRDNEIYILQVTDRIKEVLSLDTDMEPRDLLHQLLSDYNYLSHK